MTLSDAIGRVVNESLGTALTYNVIPSAKTGFSFNADDVQSICTRLKGDFVVGHIGALDDSHKGQLQIIETARRLCDSHPQISFILVGEGRDFGLFKKL